MPNDTNTEIQQSSKPKKKKTDLAIVQRRPMRIFRDCGESNRVLYKHEQLFRA